jgi:predicted nucleic acid-binding protein
LKYTIDANVFVSDAVTVDVHHADSRAFLSALRQRAEQVFCPSLVLVEAAAAIARPTGDASLALRASNLIRRFPNLKLVGLSIARSRTGAQLAANHRLRGADTVYVGVAVEYGATLITWDTEMLQRGRAAVQAMTPSDWLNSPAS